MSDVELKSGTPEGKLRNLDGLISFFGSHHAIRADTQLRRGGYASQLIPGPKELSPNCGVAVRFAFDRREEVLAYLTAKKVQIEDVHYYVPRTDAWIAKKL